MSVTPIEQNKLVLNVDEVAEILGVSKAAVYKLCNTKEFPSIKIGKRYLIPRERFIAWINEQA